MEKMEDSSRDRKSDPGETHAFCIFSLLIFFLVLGNLTLTLLIIKVLRIGYGMESIESNTLENLLKFYGDADLGELYKPDGKLSGFKDLPVVIGGTAGSVGFELIDHHHNRTPVQNLRVEKNGTHLKNVTNFEVVDPATGRPVFSTSFPKFFLPPGMSKIDVNIVHTRRIASPINTTLYLRSESVTRLKGNEGTRMRGKSVMWTADGDIFVKSVNGSLILSGKNGIILDLKSLHIAQNKFNKTVSTHYKLCVCMPSGKVFRIPMTQRYNMHLACNYVDQIIGKSPC
ncbi:beta-sarcoglycan [Bemisia tabaci]|nr:PREDICTED: beta-sarcoglycan [Bemisia tabaci]